MTRREIRDAKLKASRQTYGRGIYPTYAFTDHDPILDAVDTLIKDVGMTFEEIAHKSHVSVGTLTRWKSRATKRPQFPTLKAVVKACGGELDITFRGRKI